MRTIHFFLLASHFFLAALTAAPVPRVFEADVARPGTHQDSAYHGESLAIEAHLKSGRVPFRVPSGASATMLVSTNGVNWWPWPASVSTDGVIRATWVPAYDCGADSYRIFLGVSESGTNVNYGANMLLRLLGSPGETPNALPLPVRVLDFAKIAWTNEPWSAASGLTTNDVRAIALTRAEAVYGFTEWSFEGLPAGATDVEVQPPQYDGAMWMFQFTLDANVYSALAAYGPDATEMNLSFQDVMAEASYHVLATRTRLRPTQEQEAAWDAKASASDVAAASALTPIYSDVPTFTDWTIMRAFENGLGPEDVTSQVRQPSTFFDDSTSPGSWCWRVSDSVTPDDTYLGEYITSPLGPNAVSLSWNARFGARISTFYTGTRCRTDIVGYMLGSWTNKPLAAIGVAVARTNLPPLSASATVGDLVDLVNAVIGALQ